MAHIIEVVRERDSEARSFLDALVYSDLVSAVGYRADGEKTRAVAVNWDEDGQSDLDDRISEIIDESLDGGTEMDAHRCLPETLPGNRRLSTGTRPKLMNWKKTKISMPEIEIEINTETGESQTKINGIAGASCEKTAEAIKNVLGKPTLDEKTSDYRIAPQVKRQIKGE